MVESDALARSPHCIQQPGRSIGHHFGGVLRDLEGDLDAALRLKVVHLVREDVVDDVVDCLRLREVTIMEHQAGVLLVGVDIELVDVGGVEGARPTYYPMDLVVLGEQILRKIRIVLPGDAGDQRLLGQSYQTDIPVIGFNRCPSRIAR